MKFIEEELNTYLRKKIFYGKRLVYHHNYIGHEINESLQYYADDVFDREVYCRKQHLIKEPLENECIGYPCFAGLDQGRGHECAWEDITEIDYTIEHQERYKEYERVDIYWAKKDIELCFVVV